MRLCLFDARQIPRCHFTQDNSLLANMYECYTTALKECTWPCLYLFKHVQMLSTEMHSIFSLKCVCNLFSVSSSCPPVFHTFTKKTTQPLLSSVSYLWRQASLHIIYEPAVPTSQITHSLSVIPDESLDASYRTQSLFITTVIASTRIHSVQNFWQDQEMFLLAAVSS